MLQGSLSITVVAPSDRVGSESSTLRIPIGRAEMTATHGLPQWVDDILDLGNDEHIIDETLIVRVVSCFGRATEAGSVRGAWVPVWQFLRQHEGRFVCTRWEPAPVDVEARIMHECVGPSLTGSARAMDVLWTGPSSQTLGIDPMVLAHLRFTLAVILLCVLAGAAIPLLLRP